MLRCSCSVCNVHAGISEDDIVQFVNDCVALSLTTPQEVWCFFDEMNTCESQGLIAEILVDRKLKNLTLPQSLVFFAAANPHRAAESLKSAAAIAPKRRKYARLVYSVHPIPEKLLQCVYDFGRLGKLEEKAYVHVMCRSLTAALKTHKVRFTNYPSLKSYETELLHEREVNPLTEDLVKLIIASQEFITNNFPDFLVSLRDIKRCLGVIRFLVEFLMHKEHTHIKVAPPRSRIYFYNPKSLVMNSVTFALLICYHCRISTSDMRMRYRCMIEKTLFGCNSVLKDEYFNRKSKREENLREFETNQRCSVFEDFLLSMWHHEMYHLVKLLKRDPGVVLSNTLLENVYVVLVCLLMREPVILVGKPGMSKSLALSIIDNNLKGCQAGEAFWRHMPKLCSIPYQGSDVSNSSGIERRFLIFLM